MKQKPVASEEKGTWRLGMQSIYSNCSIFNAFALGDMVKSRVLHFQDGIPYTIFINKIIEVFFKAGINYAG